MLGSRLVPVELAQPGDTPEITLNCTLDEALAEWRMEQDRCVAAGKASVLHLCRVSGRTRLDGAPIQLDIAIIWTLREGRVVHGKLYVDQDAARRDAGVTD